MGLFGDRTARKLENELMDLTVVLRMADGGFLTTKAAGNLPGIINKIIALKKELDAKGQGAEADRLIANAKDKVGSSEKGQFAFTAIEGGHGVELA